MHDILEGLCRYIIPKVLHSFIYYSEKLFNLDNSNYRIQFFDYGNTANSKYIPAFTESALKKINYTCCYDKC